MATPGMDEPQRTGRRGTSGFQGKFGLISGSVARIPVASGSADLPASRGTAAILVPGILQGSRGGQGIPVIGHSVV